MQVPATVQAVLAARIDRLPPEEKRLLQTAAVIGTEVPFALLQAMTGQPEQACSELTTAIEMYRSMDMTFWLPQTEAALAQMEER